MNDMQPESKQLGMVLKGTTTVSVVCTDGVIMVTDTRATAGYFVAHKQAKKVFPIDNHVAMTIAGLVADCQAMHEVLKANANLFRLESGTPMPVSAVARLAANILFFSRGAPLQMQAIVGGFVSTGPRMFALDPFGTVTEENCFSTGSGSPIAIGVLESDFKEGSSIDEALPVVVRAVRSAMSRDIGTGDSFDVATVGKDGYREFSTEEKETLLKESV